MAEQSASVSCYDLEALQRRFQQVGLDMSMTMQTANTAIINAVRAQLPHIYTPKLAVLINVTEQVRPSNKMLAKIIVNANDYRVIGYEYGTRAHLIQSRQRQALAFIPQGSSNTVFAKSVQHPGTAPHDRRAQLSQVLNDSAQSAWEAALSHVLTGSE